MLKITVSRKVDGGKTAKVVGADVAFVVAAWNRCWWAQGDARLYGQPYTMQGLVEAVLALPVEMGAKVTFQHQ
jgi:hypothetical protein